LGKFRLQIRSAPDYEITGRPNSPPPELLKVKIGQVSIGRNTTIEGAHSTKEPLAKSDNFGTILEPQLVTCQPRQVLSGVSQLFPRFRTEPIVHSTGTQAMIGE
jgi:hypothetical protein